jgi:hypothetical protein
MTAVEPERVVWCPFLIKAMTEEYFSADARSLS